MTSGFQQQDDRDTLFLSGEYQLRQYVQQQNCGAQIAQRNDPVSQEDDAEPK